MTDFVKPKDSIMSNDQNEPLLKESSRMTIFPIIYPELWGLYKKAVSSFWTAEELDLSKDIDDWNKLSKDEQHFLKYVLAFFSSSDTIININLSSRFIQEVQALEARFFYNFQESIENIHCVDGNTNILTDKGYQKIKYLVNQQVNVWNGSEFSKVEVKNTGESALYTVTLSNGMTLKCTPKHKWFIRGKDGEKQVVFTENLETDFEIFSYKFPLLRNLEDTSNIPDPYGLGIYVSNSKIIYSHDTVEKRKIIGRPYCEESSYVIDKRKFGLPQVSDDELQYFVPINFSIFTKIKWFEGIVDGSGYIDFEFQNLIIDNDDIEVLKDIQLLLSTLSLQSIINENKLIICRSVINKMMTLFQFQPKFVKIDQWILTYNNIRDKSSQIYVSTITFDKTIESTFCFNEPLRHAGIFNGILTGQSETYSLLIDTYIKDDTEKHKLFQAIETIPCIKQKADWCFKWINDDTSSFAQRLIAFAIVEGIFFSGAFCAIYWLKERGKMPGLCFSNELISRDESLHVEFAVQLYSMVENKVDENVVKEMIRNAVVIEKEFIIESLPCSLLGMNSNLMSEYIEFVADRLLVQLGYSKVFNTNNPFSFMDRISLQNRTNFFEARVAEYSKANIGQTQNHSSIHEFSLDADF